MAISEEIATNSFYPDRQGHAGVISYGWNERIFEALVRQSREVGIKKRHPRDYYKRFADMEAAHQWFKDDPTVAFYTLSLGKTAGLAAVAWVSEREPVLDTGRTFDMRVYEAVEGRSRRGQAISFGNAVLAHFENTGYDGSLGLRVDDEDPDKRVYEDLGFQRVGKLTDSHIKMVRPALSERYQTKNRP
jgi:hypothetical protein